MALSNTAVPKYYGMFRDAVMRGEIPVNKEISMEMNRIDDLIANPGIYYDGEVVEGWIKYCEEELTLTDGSDLKLLDSFKLWGEQVFGRSRRNKRSVEVGNVKRRHFDVVQHLVQGYCSFPDASVIHSGKQYQALTAPLEQSMSPSSVSSVPT